MHSAHLGTLPFGLRDDLGVTGEHPAGCGIGWGPQWGVGQFLKGCRSLATILEENLVERRRAFGEIFTAC